MPPTNPHANQARQNLHEAKRQKASVRVASTTNVSVSSPGATIDGVTMVSGEDVGLFGQTTASQNGLYTWHGAASAMTRRTDASASTDMLAGDQVYVREGTANGGTNWQLKTSAAITLGTTSLTYARIDASSAFTGEVTGTDFKPTGLTGATQASRYVGATASGAPSTGTFLQRDWVVDAAGSIWICTTAGSPGTWTAVGSSIVGFFEVTGTSLFTAQADFSDAVVIQGALTTGGPLSISGGLGLLNGQALAIKSLTELTTIAAAASTLTTIQIPAWRHRVRGERARHGGDPNGYDLHRHGQHHRHLPHRRGQYGRQLDRQGDRRGRVLFGHHPVGEDHAQRHPGEQRRARQSDDHVPRIDPADELRCRAT
jgi:hypothetical protein